MKLLITTLITALTTVALGNPMADSAKKAGHAAAETAKVEAHATADAAKAKMEEKKSEVAAKVEQNKQTVKAKKKKIAKKVEEVHSQATGAATDKAAGTAEEAKKETK